MRHILALYKRTKTAQSALKAAYEADFDPSEDVDPKVLIGYDPDHPVTPYYLKSPSYPRPDNDRRKTALLHFVVDIDQETILSSIPEAVEILAESDNDPDTEYTWENAEAEAKFINVVGDTFLTGSGTPGEEDYVPPCKKLAVTL